MTDTRDEKFWREMQDELRDALDLRSFSEDEAELAYGESDPSPFSEDQITEFAKIAVSQVPREPSYEERMAAGEAHLEIDQEVGEVRGLYRNEGELDPEVEEEMRRQREDALSDEEDEEEDDAESTEKP